MAFTYALVDGFSITFLLILFISTRDRSTRLSETLVFRLTVMLTALALMSDLIAWQFDGVPGSFARVMLWSSNILLYILSGAMALTWLYFCALKMNRLSHITKLGWLAIALPFLALTVLAVLTPWTHLLFNLDASNIYKRGPLISCQMIVPFGYLIAAAVWSLFRAGKERLRQQRVEYLLLASFLLFPLAGGILQFAVYGVSLAWPCTALSLMLVYVSMQNQKISLDALTGLNNRGQFDKHIFGCVEHADNSSAFALFMLDIDHFKHINDTYGHTAGDAALIDAANLLKRSLAETNSFLARYGGDEFAIVMQYSSPAQIDGLLNHITALTEQYNATADAPYQLVFSVGYVCYDTQRFRNYQDMIMAADAQMYIQKRLHQADIR